MDLPESDFPPTHASENIPTLASSSSGTRSFRKLNRMQIKSFYSVIKVFTVTSSFVGCKRRGDAVRRTSPAAAFANKAIDDWSGWSGARHLHRPPGRTDFRLVSEACKESNWISQSTYLLINSPLKMCTSTLAGAAFEGRQV